MGLVTGDLFRSFISPVCLVGAYYAQTHYMQQFLEIVLPAFRWITPMGFCLGFMESFLWGAYIGLVLVPIHNFFYRRWET